MKRKAAIQKLSNLVNKDLRELADKYKVVGKIKVGQDMYLKNIWDYQSIPLEDLTPDHGN